VAILHQTLHLYQSKFGGKIHLSHWDEFLRLNQTAKLAGIQDWIRRWIV